MLVHRILEVFKRDCFKCQYCGRGAPEIVLELEHITPLSKGGTNDILNLVTSCWQCNSGKSDKLLDDNTVIRQQRDQLEELQERREQLEMMIRWRDANVDLDKHAVEAFARAYSERVIGWSLTEQGLKDARALIKKFGLQRALEALDAAIDHAVEYDRNGRATKDSSGGILRLAFVLAEPPEIQALYRIRARVRRRFYRTHDGVAISLLKKVHKLGASIDQIDAECNRLMAERNVGFAFWQAEMEAWVEQLTP